MNSGVSPHQSLGTKPRTVHTVLLSAVPRTARPAWSGHPGTGTLVAALRHPEWCCGHLNEKRTVGVVATATRRTQSTVATSENHAVMATSVGHRPGRAVVSAAADTPLLSPVATATEDGHFPWPPLRPMATGHHAVMATAPRWPRPRAVQTDRRITPDGHRLSHQDGHSTDPPPPFSSLMISRASPPEPAKPTRQDPEHPSEHTSPQRPRATIQQLIDPQAKEHPVPRAKRIRAPRGSSKIQGAQTLKNGSHVWHQGALRGLLSPDDTPASLVPTNCWA